MGSKHKKFTILLFSAVFFSYVTAQSLKDNRDVIRYTIDSLLIFNKDHVMRVGAASKPYILASLTVTPATKSDFYSSVQAALSDLGYFRDTGDIVKRFSGAKPVDINQAISCKNRLILSSYLPEDSIFKSRSEGIFEWVYLTTPLFFDKNQHCIIEVGSEGGGGQMLLLKKLPTGKWSFEKSISYWRY